MYSNSSKYPVVQENAQRKFGGPPENWEGPEPAKGSEIFVSNLPRNFLEHDFLPLFEQIGRIYCSRLLMEINGKNRGYCFIQYETPLIAKEAVQQLNGFTVINECRLIVEKSVDNCRLFIGQVPKHLSKEKILDILNSRVTGIKEIILYLNPHDKKKNRGFCFVEFDCHRNSAIGRKILARDETLFDGQPAKVDWAIPEQDLNAEYMDSVRVMFIRNLKTETKEKSIKQALAKFVPVMDIERIKKIKDFAFVHFNNRDSTEKAIQGLNGFILENSELSAALARPTFCAKANVNIIPCNWEKNDMDIPSSDVSQMSPEYLANQEVIKFSNCNSNLNEITQKLNLYPLVMNNILPTPSSNINTSILPNQSEVINHQLTSYKFIQNHLWSLLRTGLDTLKAEMSINRPYVALLNMTSTLPQTSVIFVTSNRVLNIPENISSILCYQTSIRIYWISMIFDALFTTSSHVNRETSMDIASMSLINALFYNNH